MPFAGLLFDDRPDRNTIRMGIASSTANGKPANARKVKPPIPDHDLFRHGERGIPAMPGMEAGKTAAIHEGRPPGIGLVLQGITGYLE